MTEYVSSLKRLRRNRNRESIKQLLMLIMPLESKIQFDWESVHNNATYVHMYV